MTAIDGVVLLGALAATGLGFVGGVWFGLIVLAVRPSHPTDDPEPVTLRSGDSERVARLMKDERELP